MDGHSVNVLIVKISMGLDLGDIQAFNQPSQLAATDFMHFPLGLRPMKFIFLQPLMPQAKTISIPVEYFQYISTTITKGKQMTRKWIMLQSLRYQYGKAVD
jgi:hypothetical protein